MFCHAPVFVKVGQRVKDPLYEGMHAFLHVSRAYFLNILKMKNVSNTICTAEWGRYFMYSTSILCRIRPFFAQYIHYIYIYLLQFCCYLVTVVILHVNKT